MQNFTLGEIDRLRALLEENDVTREILSEVQGLRIPDWCLGAGCIAQTVWNALHGFDLNRNIEDYDLAYFDSTDLSEAGEQRTAQRVREILAGLGVIIDVKNEARVHFWYKNRFGQAIRPYHSMLDAIESWPTTATSVGVRREENGDLTVIAPFGLSDLFSMIVRPNGKQLDYFLTRDDSTSREVYLQKAKRWARAWPKLTVFPWYD